MTAIALLCLGVISFVQAGLFSTLLRDTGDTNALIGFLISCVECSVAFTWLFEVDWK